MRFLNFLPFAAALVAAAPAAQPPTKDLIKREDHVCSESGGGGSVSGCFNPDHDDKYNYDKYDVEGVVVYDFKFEGTLEYYEVEFQVFNPNTEWYTSCKSGVQNARDFQRCERARTAFVINVDDEEIVTKETVTAYVKLVWVALPRALTKKKGHHGNEDEYKGLMYVQIGELTFEITCTKTTRTSTIGGGSDHGDDEDDMICTDHGQYCYAKPIESSSSKKDDEEKHGHEKHEHEHEKHDHEKRAIYKRHISKKETEIKCHFEGELTIVAIALRKGDWDGRDA
ncbi:uncharacterized protein IWZ02DRAFT_487087 [Phyllosticta citriasiana]|uniref:uncharacterized protein n=1 Tax=Phyllosticta citriasiana TaxID=595635 RepID=UPI0030FDF249